MLRFTRVFLEAAVEPLVKIAQSGAVVTLTMNRPKALNALNMEMCEELVAKLRKCDTDDSVGAIIITGEGRGFVAGADIKMMKDASFVNMFTNNSLESMYEVAKIRKPIIAAVNGFCLGGGCELAMSCDIIIASDKAIFGQPEIKIGTIPGLGGTQRLTQAIGKAKAMEWVLTGDQYTAEEAEKAGLVSRVVKHDDLIPKAMEIAQKVASYGRISVLLAKEAILRSQEMPLTEGLAYERRSFESTFATKDRKEGMTAFAEKRPPKFTND